MAKKSTGKGESEGRSSGAKRKGARPESRAVTATGGAGASNEGTRSSNQDGMGEAFIKLLQSPLVADLLAVAATAALAALAEHGFSSRGSPDGVSQKRAGRAVKEAGKAAASAIGRRLANELDEIKAASKKATASAEV